MSRSHPWGDADTPYEAVGGEAGLRALAWAFYDVVEESAPVIERMLPADRTETRQKLFEFLSGWTGGPPIYWETRGHPALRMRHAPFAIDTVGAEEWIRCMDEAADRVGLDAPVRTFLVTELGRAARQLRNVAETSEVHLLDGRP